MRNENGIGRLTNRFNALHSFTIVACVAVLIAVGTGCSQDEKVVFVDSVPPTPPDGFFSVTGDQQVTLYWNPNREPDLAGYDIYFNLDGSDTYEFMTPVSKNATSYIDTDVTNGVTKFYAMLAYDNDDLESELSYEDVFDTPRPESKSSLVLEDYLGPNSSMSGYDFSSLSGVAQAWDDPGTDVYFGAPNNIPTMFGKGSILGAGVDIQDYGYIDLIDVDWAPDAGWAPSKKAELIEGHSYVVQIEDQSGFYFYAKVYVANVTTSRVLIDWAFQIDPGNPELLTFGAQQ